MTSSDILEQMLAEQRDENAAAAKKPCTKKAAKAQWTFLFGWSKGKPIVKQDEFSTFWRCGKWTTQIPPGEITGMVNHGMATLKGNTLTLVCSLAWA